VKGLLAGSLAGAKSLMLYKGPPRNPFLSVREYYEKYTLEALQIVRNGDYAPTDGMWDDRISIADILLQAMPRSDKEYLRIVRRYEDETQKLFGQAPSMASRGECCASTAEIRPTKQRRGNGSD